MTEHTFQSLFNFNRVGWVAGRSVGILYYTDGTDKYMRLTFLCVMMHDQCVIFDYT